MPPLRTALLSFLAATAAIAAFAQLGRGVPWVAGNLGALAAVVFLVIPHWVAQRRGRDVAVFGMTMAPAGRSLAFAAGYVLVVFPLFLAGYLLFYGFACAPDAPAWAPKLAMPGFCPRWDGWAGLHAPRLGWGFVEAMFVQVVVVALPEELFFRGYLHALCEQRWPPARRVLGGGVGWAMVVSSALFAVGHLAVGFDPHRLAVFFPGLVFAWLRSATGSIFAGVIAHAASNLFVDLLDSMFF